MKRFVYYLLCTYVVSAYGQSEVPLVHIRPDKYLVDSTLAALLDTHADEIFENIAQIHRGTQTHGVWKFHWLPGYFVKYGLTRIDGMETIKDCIRRNNLYLLGVPDKKVYHIKGRPTTVSNLNYAVIVKEVSRDLNPRPLTLEHVRQLSVLIERSHYVDLHVSNYVRTAGSKLFIIDTEGIFDKKLHIEGFLKLFCSNYYLSSSYTPSALKFLFHQVKERLKKGAAENRFYFSKIDRAFAKQKEPHTWDFVSYCNSLIAGYKTESPAFLWP